MELRLLEQIITWFTLPVIISFFIWLYSKGKKDQAKENRIVEIEKIKTQSEVKGGIATLFDTQALFKKAEDNTIKECKSIYNSIMTVEQKTTKNASRISTVEKKVFEISYDLASIKKDIEEIKGIVTNQKDLNEKQQAATDEFNKQLLSVLETALKEKA
jgi:hypothetical protein